MAYTITRLQMKNSARRKADGVNDDHLIDDDGVTDYLDEECNELIAEIWHEILVVDPDRLVDVTTIATTAGTQMYAVPATFMSLRRLDRVDGTRRTMIELDMDDVSGSGNECRYRLVGGGQTGSGERLHLRPDPGTGSYELWYCVAPPVLTADANTFDSRFGEHKFVIAGLAAFIKERQDDDSTPFRILQERARQHVQTMARRRDAGRAKQITDVRSQRDGRTNYPRP
jgi:hypothetical protein